ncbi:MAG: hypothetical protein SO108_01220 [Bacilli bacterium]|nr:hypothetical protein [Bacilli bacterium]
MEIGQLILLKNIDRIGGRKQPITKTIRPAVVREILGENIINVRLVSTIYVNEKVKPQNLQEAKEAIANNLRNVLPHEKQYIILSPEEDGVLNFSYVYGNMYTDTIDLNSTNHIILKDKKTKKPIIISLDTKIKIEEKEIEALTENIIKEYAVEFKRKVTAKDTISV